MLVHQSWFHFILRINWQKSFYKWDRKLNTFCYLLLQLLLFSSLFPSQSLRISLLEFVDPFSLLTFLISSVLWRPKFEVECTCSMRFLCSNPAAVQHAMISSILCLRNKAFKNYILEPSIDISRMLIATFGTRLWSSTFLKKDKTKNKLACTITSAKVSLLTRWKKWLQFFVLSSLNTERWKLGFLCKLFEVSLLADYTLIGSREIPVCMP